MFLFIMEIDGEGVAAVSGANGAVTSLAILSSGIFTTAAATGGKSSAWEIVVTAAAAGAMTSLLVPVLAWGEADTVRALTTATVAVARPSFFALSGLACLDLPFRA